MTAKKKASKVKASEPLDMQSGATPDLYDPAMQSSLIMVHSGEELHALERKFAEASKNEKLLPVHKLPEGMNRNNSVQDFLMVIIEELWRIEDILHDKA